MQEPSWWVFRAGPRVELEQGQAGDAVLGRRPVRLAGCAHTSGLRVTCYCCQLLTGGKLRLRSSQGQSQVQPRKPPVSQDRSDDLESVSENDKLRCLRAPVRTAKPRAQRRHPGPPAGHREARGTSRKRHRRGWSPPAQSGWAWPRGEQRPEKGTGTLLWETGGDAGQVASGPGGAGGGTWVSLHPWEDGGATWGEEVCGDDRELTAE